MPKGRYAIMRRYMPRVGALGLDMMTRTCTVQVNLDYSSERDMVRKLRVSLALQPLATALFANSPFTEGRPNGFLSYRAHVWTDTDPDRTGMPAVFFDDGFGFERYVEWLLDVPMYFVYRDGRYVDLAGALVPPLHGGRSCGTRRPVRATMGDFADHMTTVFTDVRVKRFLEMRGADAGTPAMMVAQSALWVGLLYDDAALAAARRWCARTRGRRSRRSARWCPGRVLRRRGPAGRCASLARDMVAIARDGLRARARRNAAGQDETIYLAPLRGDRRRRADAGGTLAGAVSWRLAAGCAADFFRGRRLTIRSDGASGACQGAGREVLSPHGQEFISWTACSAVDCAGRYGRDPAAPYRADGSVDAEQSEYPADRPQDARCPGGAGPVGIASGAARPAGRTAVEPSAG